VLQNEGLVKVVQGNADPRDLYAREHPGHALVHTGRGPMVTADSLG